MPLGGTAPHADPARARPRPCGHLLPAEADGPQSADPQPAVGALVLELSRSREGSFVMYWLTLNAARQPSGFLPFSFCSLERSDLSSHLPSERRRVNTCIGLELLRWLRNLAHAFDGLLLSHRVSSSGRCTSSYPSRTGLSALLQIDSEE